MAKDFQEGDIIVPPELINLRNEAEGLVDFLNETHLHRTDLTLSDYYDKDSISTACLIPDTPENRHLLVVARNLLEQAREILQAVESEK